MGLELVATQAPGEPVPVPATAEIGSDDLAGLRAAVGVLERSTLTGRLSSIVGRPLDLIGHALPEAARAVIGRAVESALGAALKLALTTLPAEQAEASQVGLPSRGRLHGALAAAVGAAGGALGLATLPIELPVSTALMLRAIAAVAREEGEDLSRPETGLACLQVFALGSRTEADDLASGGYFAVRGALARSVSEAARVAAGRGLSDGAAPAAMRLVAQIAARFGIVVSQKVAAAAVPVVGALGGAVVNAAFTAHFRAVARAHFTVRRLERRYGAPAVRAAYDRIVAELG